MPDSIKPICKICKKEGKKYKVYEPIYNANHILGITLGYWDEDGKYSKPKDYNEEPYKYSCSNKHSWTELNAHCLTFPINKCV